MVCDGNENGRIDLPVDHERDRDAYNVVDTRESAKSRVGKRILRGDRGSTD